MYNLRRKRQCFLIKSDPMVRYFEKLNKNLFKLVKKMFHHTKLKFVFPEETSNF